MPSDYVVCRKAEPPESGYEPETTHKTLPEALEAAKALTLDTKVYGRSALVEKAGTTEVWSVIYEPGAREILEDPETGAVEVSYDKGQFRITHDARHRDEDGWHGKRTERTDAE